MIRQFLAGVATVALGFAQPALAQQRTVVSFAKGKSASTVSGSIKGDQDHSYIVDARAGQTLTVMLKPTKGSPYINITAPGADSAMFIGSTEGNRFSGPLTTSGRHVIQVHQMRATARRGELASYTLDIGVTGGSAGGRDALVPGTKYHATADIPCVTAAGAGPGVCKAGVVRRGGGTAMVDMKTPDGGQRTIYFTAGRATGSDAQASFKVTRQGDLSIVRIGTVEMYRIPDAFVVGG